MRSLLVLIVASALSLAAVESTAPWLPALAALTDNRSAVHAPAMESLIRHGEDAVEDVAALSADVDWQLRARVATVLAGIGGDKASAALVNQATDRDERVREVVAAALGKTPGAGSLKALQALAMDPVLRVRIAAVQGLGSLGDVGGMATLTQGGEGEDQSLRVARAEALRRLLNRPDRIMAAAQALTEWRGLPRRQVLEAVAGIGDPRLTPALVDVLGTGDDLEAALAARALLSNGDTRALEALCALAADSKRIQPGRFAADTLARMTGVNATAGATWSIWWRENAAAAAALYERDTFIAACHDPDYHVDVAELQKHSPENLMPLIDGILGEGAWWWRQRAGRIMLLDDPARWTSVLLRRIESSPSGEDRLALIILIDQYGDPGAAEGLARLYAERADQAVEGRNDPERAALAIALERRGKKVGPNPVPRSRR